MTRLPDAAGTARKRFAGKLSQALGETAAHLAMLCAGQHSRHLGQAGCCGRPNDPATRCSRHSTQAICRSAAMPPECF